MTTEWPLYTLANVCEFLDRRGVTPEKLGSRFVDSGFRVISAKNIKARGIDTDVGEQRFVNEPTYRRWMKSPLLADDVLLTSEAPLGEPAYVSSDLSWCLGQRLFGIRTNKSKVFGRFLFYAFQSPVVRSDLLARATGATAQGIRQAELKNVAIPVPPLPEQRRIVGILDAAFEGIATAKANAEKNLQNARALFESYLKDVFTPPTPTWVADNLRSVTTKIGSGATPRGGEESYKTEGISLIRSLNVHDLGFKYAKLAFLDAEQADELSNVEVRPDDVLVNITGASVARCCVVPRDVLPARVNQHVIIVRPISEKLNPYFLHYLLISEPYKRKLLQTGEDGGSTRQAITKAQMQEFSIAYPRTHKEQEAIVAKADAILGETNRLVSIYERKFAALDALKQSLLHQAFTGQL